MPEGPEVKRMGVDLSKTLSGKDITAVKILSGRYTKKTPDGLQLFLENLPMKIVGTGVHGKFLYILTSKGYNIWSTLGMTGRWSNSRTKHSRVELILSDKNSVFFNDQRNFGTFKMVYGPYKLKGKLKKLGPDMLSEEITASQFIERLRKKDEWNITKALMDQSVIAGVGNYIKAESLWLSGHSPLKNVSDFTDYDLVALCDAIQSIMLSSYEHGGATFLTHKNFSGSLGDYSHRFLCYNRKVDAEGNEVIKTKTPDGRTTHWSPNKQK